MSSMKKKPSGNGPARSNVAVAIRVRPASDQEGRDTIIVKTNKMDSSVVVRTKSFTNFDKVYGPNSRQSEIYADLVKKQVEDVLRGYSCTIFAYGQTGTGKTFTMEGGEGSIEGDWETDETTGIIPRAAQHVFSELASREGIEFIVRVSYVEIYNEEMIDLLGTNSSEDKHLIRLFEDPAKKGSIVISGVEEVPVRCRDDVYRLLKQGTEQRRTAETLMNKRSSRSHSVLTISVLIRESLPSGEELVKQGKLRLVDLAGSENIGRSGAEGKRAKEAGNINTSLLALGRVINALTTNAPHVPYRESKLTRLLQDSLGGSSITTIIATLSPVNSNYEESISTLEYAHRAMNIKNKPEVNENVNKKDLFKEYSGTIDRLMKELKAARDKDGVYLAQEQYDEMGEKIETSATLIASLEQQLQDTLELMKKHLADISLMDEVYGKAYTRVKNLEERLAMRVLELEEATMTIAKEKHEHALTRRALGRSRSHADGAFEVAEETKRVGWEAIHELRRLHPRTDCIEQIGKENLMKAKELRHSMETAVGPMREANGERMQKGAESVQRAEAAQEMLNGVVAREIPVAKSAIERAGKIMENLLNATTSIDLGWSEKREGRTKEMVEAVTMAKVSMEGVIGGLMDEMEKTREEAERKVREMEESNEAMRKEMEALRAECKEAVAKAQEKRKEGREEMEKKRNEMMMMMTKWMEEAAAHEELMESGQREEDETIGERLATMHDVEMGWSDQMEEANEALKTLVNESTEKAKANLWSCLPSLSSIGSTTEEYCRASGEEDKEWKREKKEIEEQRKNEHDSSISDAVSSIAALSHGHEVARGEISVNMDVTKSLLAESSSRVEGDLMALMKMVEGKTEKMNEIPPKDMDEVRRELEDNESPPSEEDLYAEEEEEEEEEEGEGEERENHESELFRQKKMLRRSRFRVRDSILVAGDDLQSPSKILIQRNKIDEEGSESSFGSDRTNRRAN